MTARSPMILGLAALLATLLSAMGSLPPDGGAPQRPPIRGVAEGPFRCDLSLRREGSGTAVLARVTATEAVAGTYALSLRAGGNSIDQGGDFEAVAGETVTLSEATLPGAPAALDGALTVTAKGRSVACPRGGG